MSERFDIVAKNVSSLDPYYLECQPRYDDTVYLHYSAKLSPGETDGIRFGDHHFEEDHALAVICATSHQGGAFLGRNYIDTWNLYVYRYDPAPSCSLDDPNDGNCAYYLIDSRGYHHKQ